MTSLLIALTSATLAGTTAPSLRAGPSNPDSAAVVAVVERFHAALASGDSAAALGCLVNDAVILESGELETAAAYRAHHLPADMEFARAVRSDRKRYSVRILGDVAWVITTSVTQGTFRDRPIDSVGAELIVLRRAGNDWKIAAIHWSAHSRRRG